MLLSGVAAGILFYGDYKVKYEYFAAQHAKIQKSISQTENDIESIKSFLEKINSVVDKQNADLKRIKGLSDEDYQKFSSNVDKIKNNVKRWHDYFVGALLNLNTIIKNLQADIEDINKKKIMVLETELSTLKEEKIPAIQKYIEEVKEENAKRAKSVEEEDIQDPSAVLREQRQIGPSKKNRLD